MMINIIHFIISRFVIIINLKVTNSTVHNFNEGNTSCRSKSELPESTVSLETLENRSENMELQDLTYDDSNEYKKKNFKCIAKGHAKALLSKNWYRITRHPG